MIVVIGQPVLGRVDGEPVATGSAARIALAAAARGSVVQLVGKVGEDPDGEALVLALAQGDVGHVAVQRDPTHPTPRAAAAGDDAAGSEDAASEDAKPALDAADIELALRYLTEFRVIVVADALDDAALRVAADATGWTNGTLIAILAAGKREPDGLPAEAIVLGSPAGDPDGAFDRLVGELAAAVDAGGDPRAAFHELVGSGGWEPAGT